MISEIEMNHRGQPMAGDLENRDNAYPRPYSSSSNNQDTSEKKWIFMLVPALVFVNVVMFIITMSINNCPKNENASQGHCVMKGLGRFSFQPLRENPVFGPSYSTLEKLGALEWDKVVHGHQGWRLVSCLWLHASVIHLVANTCGLLFIGMGFERQFGFVRTGVIYLVSGFGGSVLSGLFIRGITSVGASGALFGLLGATFSEIFTNWTMYYSKAEAFLSLGILIAANLAVGILPHVNNFAHIGGLLTGFLLGCVLLLQPQFGWVERLNLPVSMAVMAVKSEHTAYQKILWVVSLVLLIVGFIVGLAMLFEGINAYERCHWCRYLNCVPTSRGNCGSN